MDGIWELSDSRATKWSGIAVVFDLLGVDPTGAVGLGDGENDVVWMERIGTPVAMGNSRPEAISGHPRTWGWVGPSGNRRANHVATAGWKAPSIAPFLEPFSGGGELPQGV